MTFCYSSLERQSLGLCKDAMTTSPPQGRDGELLHAAVVELLDGEVMMDREWAEVVRNTASSQVWLR